MARSSFSFQKGLKIMGRLLLCSRPLSNICWIKELECLILFSSLLDLLYMYSGQMWGEFLWYILWISGEILTSCIAGCSACTSIWFHQSSTLYSASKTRLLKCATRLVACDCIQESSTSIWCVSPMLCILRAASWYFISVWPSPPLSVGWSKGQQSLCRPWGACLRYQFVLGSSILPVLGLVHLLCLWLLLPQTAWWWHLHMLSGWWNRGKFYKAFSGVQNCWTAPPENGNWQNICTCNCVNFASHLYIIPCSFTFLSSGMCTLVQACDLCPYCMLCFVVIESLTL